MRKPRKQERLLEAYANRIADRRGCLKRKMNGLGFRGWPDRMYIAPDIGYFDGNPPKRGAVAFLELKREDGRGKLSKGQENMLENLERRGVYARWAETRQEVDAFFDEWLGPEAVEGY